MSFDRAAPRTRIQRKNVATILEAALDVFSTYGFRGATLDQIATEAGLSKPNLLYYFKGKEEIHVALLSDLLETWLTPLQEIDPNGDPRQELMTYVHRKLEMSRNYPRESRLFANEILNGAPRIEGFIRNDLRPLVEQTCTVIERWMDEGKLAPTDPMHLIFSIWSLTQHYADFATQIRLIIGEDEDPYARAELFLDQLFAPLLAPPSSSRITNAPAISTPPR